MEGSSCRRAHLGLPLKILDRGGEFHTVIYQKQTYFWFFRARYTTSNDEILKVGGWGRGLGNARMPMAASCQATNLDSTDMERPRETVCMSALFGYSGNRDRASQVTRAK